MQNGAKGQQKARAEIAVRLPHVFMTEAGIHQDQAFRRFN